jgi:hypothetical protein
MSKQTSSFRKAAPVYGCWNVIREKGYTTLTPNPRHVNSKDHGTEVPLEITVIEDVMSQECHYDRVSQDPRCKGCVKPDYHNNIQLLKAYKLVGSAYLAALSMQKTLGKEVDIPHVSTIWDKSLPEDKSGALVMMELISGVHDFTYETVEKLNAAKTYQELAIAYSQTTAGS